MTKAAPVQEQADVLVRPLPAGAPVSYWQLGPTLEARYDVPDAPMHGDMDPFFFLTKHKNFIPHEYPCRTRFRAERRGKRPQVRDRLTPARYWLPFGSPRLDLSGFWFRPTTLATWARAIIRAEKAGPATLRLGTCGGAVLFVNDAEIGFMADYGRNLETKSEFAVELTAGDNRIDIFFDDLAERDARYFIELDYVAGPKAEEALPVPLAADIAAAMEAALDGMHFEKPVYRDGEVALVTDTPLPRAASAAIAVEGDFMSIEAPLVIACDLRAGETRLVLAETDNLPADFRHFKVSLTIDGFTVSRPFGVEICHAGRQGTAPEAPGDRIAEALAEIAAHAERDTVRALARLAIGQGGADTDDMILGALPAVEDCHDCADFVLVPLIWCRAAYADKIAPEVIARIDAAMLGYRYWMDEPGNDVQWYFSENHALLFHTSAYLAGHLLPAKTFRRSGRTGAEQSAVGAERVRAWLDHFEHWEMAEFNSAPYFPIDLKGLTALMALAPDADIRDRAEKAIKRLLAIVARSAHHGLLTGAQGRSYEHTLRAAGSLELTGIARMLWGTGNYGTRVHALPLLALCLRDHGLKIDPDLQAIADYRGAEAREWVFAQGQDRIAKLYHYKTESYAMGSAAHYRWDEWGYQETVLHVRLGDDPDAQIFINHPGETIHSGYGRPSFWGGSGTLPRLHQYRNLCVLRFRTAEEQPDFTHAFFAPALFDKAIVGGDHAVAQSGQGVALLKADAALQTVDRGPSTGLELRARGHETLWMVRLGDARRFGGAEKFAELFSGLALEETGAGDWVVTDPEYGKITFFADGRVAGEGRELDPATWEIAGTTTILPLGRLI